MSLQDEEKFLRKLQEEKEYLELNENLPDTDIRKIPIISQHEIRKTKSLNEFYENIDFVDFAQLRAYYDERKTNENT